MELLIITVVLGLFGAVILYVSNIFNSKSASLSTESAQSDQAVKERPRKKSESVSQSKPKPSVVINKDFWFSF